MLGVYEGARFLVYDIGGHFGAGFALGMMTMAILFWLVSRTIGEGSDGQ